MDKNKLKELLQAVIDFLDEDESKGKQKEKDQEMYEEDGPGNEGWKVMI